MQRCAVGHGAACSEIHVRHVHRHCTVLYLVRQRHFLGCLTLKSYNRPYTGDNDSTFTQVHIGKDWKGLALGMAGWWMHRVLAFAVRIMFGS